MTAGLLQLPPPCNSSGLFSDLIKAGRGLCFSPGLSYKQKTHKGVPLTLKPAGPLAPQNQALWLTEFSLIFLWPDPHLLNPAWPRGDDPWEPRARVSSVSADLSCHTEALRNFLRKKLFHVRCGNCGILSRRLTGTRWKINRENMEWFQPLPLSHGHVTPSYGASRFQLVVSWVKERCRM